MGLFSDWLHYDRTSGTNTMTTAQKTALHNAYKRYAKRQHKEVKQKTGLKYNKSDQTVEVRYSTGAFVNSPEYQNLAMIKKYNVDLTTEQCEKMAAKTATLLRKERYGVTVLGYGNLAIYKK